MVSSLALCPDDTKQDSVVYGAEFGVVFLAKGPHTASIQEGIDCLRLNNSGVVILTYKMVIHINKLYVHTAVVTHIVYAYTCTAVNRVRMYMYPDKKYTGTWYTNQYKKQYCTSTYI